MNADVLASRITEYLSAGALFNPEHMEHEKVRDLLIDCREFLHSCRPPFTCSPVFWEHEDELPAMPDDAFSAIFAASRLSEGAWGVRVYPYVNDAFGNKIFITQ